MGVCGGPICGARVTLRGATLTTGFVKEGLEVLSPKEILKNYLRTQLSCAEIGSVWRASVFRGAWPLLPHAGRKQAAAPVIDVPTQV